MPSAPWCPCMPFDPGKPGSPLVIKNYLDYREMLYRCLNDKYLYIWGWGWDIYIFNTLSQKKISSASWMDSLMVYYLDSTDEVTVFKSSWSQNAKLISNVLSNRFSSSVTLLFLIVPVHTLSDNGKKVNYM